MKNIIIRKCQGCKTVKSRDEMHKITLVGGTLHINPNSKIFGRSLYVCKNEECIKNLIKTKGIRRALKYNNEEEIKRVEKELTKASNPA